MTHKETHRSITYAPQLITRAQVLVTIERNGYVTLKFIQKQSLPASNEVEQPDTVRREVNSAMQKS